MSIIYRQASLKDYKAVLDVLTESLHLHAEALPALFDKDSPVFTPHQYQNLLYSSNTEVIVAEYNNKVIGASVVELRYTPPVNNTPPCYSAYIQYFSIKEEFRHKGVGKELFHVVKTWASSNGASDLQLTVWSFNTKAIRFYQKLGLIELNKVMFIPLN